MKTKENSTNKAAEILRVLGHPSRIEILQLLSKGRNKKMTVTEIQEKLRLPQPETSKHLIAMKNKSILIGERKNGYSMYKINPALPFIDSIIRFSAKK